jgi:hypothetical protein
MDIGSVVSPFVEALRVGREPLELELRMGRRSGHGFSAKVTKHEMDTVLRTIAETKSAKDTHEFNESHDYFFNQAGETVRSTVTFDVTDFTMNTTHIIKKQIARVDAQRFRVACALETPVLAQSLPFATSVHHMRIKQRRSISVGPTELTRPLWRYDFTMVWDGDSKQSAELNQRANHPVYEVEVEVLPGGASELLGVFRASLKADEVEQAVVSYLIGRLQEIGHAIAALMDKT